MSDIRAEKEAKRLKNLLNRADIATEKKDALNDLINNIAWLKIRLDDTREEIQNASVIEQYDNGGGQTGTHLNPAYKGYLELWRGYMLGLSSFMGYLPEDAQGELNADATVLEKVKRMRVK